MYKLVVLDVDDTIVSTRNKMSDATKKAILAVQKRGVKVTLASGRMYQTMRRLADELAITLPLITCNGALVRDEKNHLFCQMLDQHTAKAVLDFFERKGQPLQLYTSDGLYSKKKCEQTWRLEESEGLPCNLVSEDCYGNFCQNLLKMLIRLEFDQINDYQTELEESFAESISVATSHRVYLEITGPGIDKGNALKALAASLSLERTDILAIGDSPNDQKMLEWAGLGIAMGNAHPAVKTIADAVAPSIEEDGVAATLEKYILSR